MRDCLYAFERTPVLSNFSKLILIYQARCRHAAFIIYYFSFSPFTMLDDFLRCAFTICCFVLLPFCVSRTSQQKAFIKCKPAHLTTHLRWWLPAGWLSSRFRSTRLCRTNCLQCLRRVTKGLCIGFSVGMRLLISLILSLLFRDALTRAHYARFYFALLSFTFLSAACSTFIYSSRHFLAARIPCKQRRH
jgi:hypothetical protein